MATITGTSGNDTRIGTASADTIRGLGGADLLWGRGGKDRIEGGIGNDSLYGEAGADLLDGGIGNDRLDGGSSNDTLRGGAGNDLLIGGPGDDLFYGGPGNDRIEGGSGRDTVSYFESSGAVEVDLHDSWFVDGPPFASGAEGRDVLISIERVRGSLFDDYIHANEDEGGVDVTTSLELFGLAGNDLIVGGMFDDILEGNDGNDSLHGYIGSDRLFGGNGDDWLAGGSDDDVLFGGAGRDTFYFNEVESEELYDEGFFAAGRHVFADFTRGQDRLSVRFTPGEFDGPWLPGDVLTNRQVFTYLDTNHNGRLDEPDAKVAIRAVTLDGQLKSSLVITFDTDAQLTLFGVTTLTASDVVI